MISNNFRFLDEPLLLQDVSLEHDNTNNIDSLNDNATRE